MSEQEMLAVTCLDCGKSHGTIPSPLPFDTRLKCCGEVNTRFRFEPTMSHMKPEPVDVNEVRAAAERITTNGHWRYWECEGPVNAMTDGKLLARFARAVLDPPREVAEAVERYRGVPFVGGGRDYSINGHSMSGDQRLITDYYLSLTAPTAPTALETP